MFSGGPGEKLLCCGELFNLGFKSRHGASCGFLLKSKPRSKTFLQPGTFFTHWDGRAGRGAVGPQGHLGIPLGYRELFFLSRSQCLDNHGAEVQPEIPDSCVFTGGAVRHHDCIIGDFNLPAADPAGGGEGVRLRRLLLGHPRSDVGRPAAGLHGAVSAVPHPQLELRGGVSPPQLLFHGGLQRGAGH